MLKGITRAALAMVLLAVLAGGTYSQVQAARAYKPYSVGAWAGQPKSGHALYYTDRAMRRVGAVRIRQGLITHIREDVDGYAAVTDCSKIGQVAYATINGGRMMRLQVLDCSAPWDVAAHVAAHRVIEVNHSVFTRNGVPAGAGRAPATLWAIEEN